MSDPKVYRKDFTGSGSSYTRGIGSFRDTQAVRVGHIYTSDASALELKTAVDHAVTLDGTTHPQNSSLQLKRATALRIDAHITRVQMVYGYGASSVPTATADQLTRSDSGYYTFKSWKLPTTFDANGRPSGDYNFEAPSETESRRNPPRPIYLQLPQQVVRIRTVLASNPTNAVLTKLGRTNSDAVTYAGKTYGALTVRFDRLWIEPIEIDGSVRYQVEYTMVFRLAKWVQELEPIWDSGAWTARTGSEIVDTYYARSCPEDTFANAFPVHA